ncbi:MAG: methylated-DNA--[protein]-cysteine S-methyltransferase [Candidatus Micrarchaeia archaeon]
MVHNEAKCAEAAIRRSKLTLFQKSVLLAVLHVPPGSVTTYKDIANAIRKPDAVRAVGSALSRNPLPIAVPCHRIIRSDGKLGGYAFGGIKAKISLLNKEAKKR